jgi:hypothetical protein
VKYTSPKIKPFFCFFDNFKTILSMACLSPPLARQKFTGEQVRLNSIFPIFKFSEKQ